MGLSQPNLHPVHPGTVVMVKDRSCLPLGWKIALVEEVHPGCDGLVRVATIKAMVGNT
jgi:hypothetical protein